MGPPGTGSEPPPELAGLAPFIGTWRGEGRGHYPTISSFGYDEELTFEVVGARLAFHQRTWNPETGAGMHVESGYWRPIPPDRVEVVIAHPTGLAEVQEGTVDDGKVELRSTAVAHTTTAKRVDIIERTYRVRGDVLRYTIRMAAVSQPLGDHLAAELQRLT